MRASSPSTPMAAWGVFASITYQRELALRYYSRDSAGRWAHVVIIAMRAVLIALLIYSHVFAESFFALFTHEGHFRCPYQWMRLCLGVTLGAVEPLLATRSTDGNLGI
jgi:hypothetical protein